MRNFISLCFVLILMVSFAVPSEGKEVTKDFHKSFDVDEGSRLRLKHGDGDVTIQPWDRDVLDIVVYYKASVKSIGWGGTRDFDVLFEQKGDLIEVIGKEKSSSFAGILYYHQREYTYTIRAPRYLELVLEGEDGDVEIDNWDGDIDCDLEDGDIYFQNVHSADTNLRLEDGEIRIEGHDGRLSIEGEDGDITIIESKIPSGRIQLDDGEIRVRYSEGNFDIEGCDGDIKLYRLQSSKLDIESEDGDIEVELTGTEKIDMDVRTEDGDITLHLPPTLSVAFTIDVDDGDIDIDLPSAKVLEKKRRWIAGETHGGEGRIKIVTSDGDVTLKETRK